ncbi:MAG TPA: tRNA (adenosine(37)-N6)-dimethylallyltransferase MiaA [Woeseiaceae bacterium]|nr:tRNA (adenosine(37)-N6)-dimethylallyltransferase MiaA [Woeseiaceae bacterium]
MGPTASGKTELAIELCRRFPLDVISVDSALVYRGMDIGTAKPDAATLRATPHRLIDIRDPEDSYSAGDFVRDAGEAMRAIFESGRTPLLVGGTMMYFRSLTEGMADLPPADARVRAAIDDEAAKRGWPALHEELERIDPGAAARIDPNDSQRIQRALEVHRLSGRALSAWQASTEAPGDVRFQKLALRVEPRSLLHERIALRLERMLDAGFLDEVRRLMQRPGLHRDSPAMRAVGYRQFWAHLAGDCSFDEAHSRALAATRQLAKRQMTWLRSENALKTFDALDSRAVDAISGFLAAPDG